MSKSCQQVSAQMFKLSPWQLDAEILITMLKEKSIPQRYGLQVIKNMCGKCTEQRILTTEKAETTVKHPTQAPSRPFPVSALPPARALRMSFPNSRKSWTRNFTLQGCTTSRLEGVAVFDTHPHIVSSSDPVF